MLTYAWYEQYWKQKETTEFNTWWLCHYGPLEDYVYQDNKDDVAAYYIRKGFALQGWLARGQ